MSSFLHFAAGFISSSFCVLLVLFWSGWEFASLQQSEVITSPVFLDHDTGCDKLHKSSSTKNIFIDIGANRGDTFLSMLQEDAFLPAHIARRDVDAYLFEASPIWNDLLHNMYTQYPQIKAVYNATAMGVDSSQNITFFMDPNNHEASSTEHKMNGAERVTVRCVAMCEWMLTTMQFSVADFIVVKMDIEGGEYTLMQHIYDNPECLSLFDEMFVEWHPWGQPQWTDGVKHHYLEKGHTWSELFQEKGVVMHVWHR